MRLTALTLLALAAAPAAAAAAPPWSAPQSVSDAHLFISDPSLVAVGDGTALAGWRRQDGVRRDARTSEQVAGRAPGADAFGRPRRVPEGRIGDLVAYGRSRVALALLRPAGSNRAPRAQLRVAYGRSNGRFSASRLVARRARVAAPAFAGSARGDLALAWFEDRGTSNDRVYVALRRPGGRFGRPVPLATGRIRSVAVAVGPRGQVLVAWDARGVVRARFKPAGRRFAATDTVRSQPAYFATLRAAVTAGGRAYLAWAAQFRSEGGDTGPVFVQAAARPPGGRFGTAELLERLGPERAANPVALAADTASGRAIVGWTGFDGATNRVRIAETGPDGRFSVRQDLSAIGADAVLDDVDASPAGGRAAVWTVFGPGERRRVQGARAGAGAAFGAPEDISAGAQADTARAAFVPDTDRLVAVWVERPAGSAGPLTSIRTYLQAAARSG